ncbi:MAG: hypothetical protein OXC54_04220 [Rhodospirillaceae bacterium]|nr:hypothetical protein [Rhodospirillaceae bacterium]MCY4310509.1 hypothetical protein [Rhodospirillaceae bacterium]
MGRPLAAQGGRPFSDRCGMILRCADGLNNKMVAVARCRIAPNLPSGGNGGTMPAICESSSSIIGLRPGIVATVDDGTGKMAS